MVITCFIIDGFYLHFANSTNDLSKYSVHDLIQYELGICKLVRMVALGPIQGKCIKSVGYVCCDCTCTYVCMCHDTLFGVCVKPINI